MAPGASHASQKTRKRTRKRKRRNVSSSSSSSELSDTDSDLSPVQEPAVASNFLDVSRSSGSLEKIQGASKDERSSSEEEYHSFSNDSSGSDSSSDSEAKSGKRVGQGDAGHCTLAKGKSKQSTNLLKSDVGNIVDCGQAENALKQRDASFVSVQDVPVDYCLPEVRDKGSVPIGEEKQSTLRERFRKFWLASVADAFADDLNEIRKETNLTPARLNLLIDSLAAGMNVYTTGGKGTNEIEVVLGD